MQHGPLCKAGRTDILIHLGFSKVGGAKVKGLNNENCGCQVIHILTDTACLWAGIYRVKQQHGVKLTYL